jgi:ABC-2 type transport system permease protein
VNEIAIIVRKELTELVSDRQSFSGTLIQASVVILLCGVFVPSRGPALFGHPTELVMIFAIFPSLVGAVFSADSFAGERERNTLETLLATPVSDRAIYLGKVLAAVGISVTCALVALAAALVTAHLQGEDAWAELGLSGVALLAGGALAFALTATAVATAISSRLRVARSAQQMSSILTLVLSMLFLWLTTLVPLASPWGQVLAVEGVLTALGLAALALGLRTFTRHRLFD